MKSFNILKILFYLTFTIILFAISFVIKKLVLVNIYSGFDNFLFKLEYVTNTGAAFSMLQNAAPFLIAAAFIILFYIVCYTCYNSCRLGLYVLFLLSSLSAGICSNLFERIAHGYVIDYISLKHIPFPVFNFSDILIVASCFLLIVQFLFFERKKVKND